jgi:hypothetical protein
MDGWYGREAGECNYLSPARKLDEAELFCFLAPLREMPWKSK